MFVRRKKNRSGSVSVVVVDKHNGKFAEVKKFGVSKEVREIESLSKAAQDWVNRFGGQSMIDFEEVESQEEALMDARRLLSSINKVLLDGCRLILNRVYDGIGFNQINDEVLRHLVIARICQPMSKLATTSYLKSHFDQDVDLSKIYRYMDKLYDTQREIVQQISVAHTRQVLGGRIELVFYDVTTLYFESSALDNLRTPGFSKDGKTAESQVVLGLLVSTDGYPLSYSLFNGAQFEGRTMIPIIDDFVQRFNLTDFVIVADSGLLSSKNVKLLNEGGYKYIVGARIRNENAVIKEWILSLERQEGGLYEYPKTEVERLIVSYSSKRAAKDDRNRRKGIARLEQECRSGKITKEHINKRGYNKFLTISKDVRIEIDQDKIAGDSLWDGMKGYITNTTLSAAQVIEQYHGLWVVERAFRISKGTLEIRPMFHFTERRIEAHVCICFVAYKVYKELERLLRTLAIQMSVDKVLSIAKTIPTVSIALPNGDSVVQTLFLTPEQQEIRVLFPNEI